MGAWEPLSLILLVTHHFHIRTRWAIHILVSKLLHIFITLDLRHLPSLIHRLHPQNPKTPKPQNPLFKLPNFVSKWDALIKRDATSIGWKVAWKDPEKTCRKIRPHTILAVWFINFLAAGRRQLSLLRSCHLLSSSLNFIPTFKYQNDFSEAKFSTLSQLSAFSEERA